MFHNKNATYHAVQQQYDYASLGCISGLEKLTNANRSVSTGNDRLFPVELTEIADWKSMSEYMLHSNFGKKIDKGHWREFWCIYLYIASLFPKYLSTFLDVLSTERILKQNKNMSEFPRTNSGRFRPLESFCSSSVSEVVLNAADKSSCFNVRVIKNKKKL